MALHPDFDQWSKAVGTPRWNGVKVELVTRDFNYINESSPGAILDTAYVRAANRTKHTDEGTFAPYLDETIDVNKNAINLGVAFRVAGTVIVKNLDGRFDSVMQYEPLTCTVYWGDPEWDLDEMYTTIYPVLNFQILDEREMEFQLGEYGAQMDRDMLSGLTGAGLGSNKNWRPRAFSTPDGWPPQSVGDGLVQCHDGPIFNTSVGAIRKQKDNGGTSQFNFNMTKNLTTGVITVHGDLKNLQDYNSLVVTAGGYADLGTGTSDDNFSMPRIVEYIIETYAGLTCNTASFDYANDRWGYHTVDPAEFIAYLHPSILVKNQKSVRQFINELLNPVNFWVTSNDDGEIIIGWIEQQDFRRAHRWLFDDAFDELYIGLDGVLGSATVNDWVTITGMSNSAFNGQFQVTGNSGDLFYIYDSGFDGEALGDTSNARICYGKQLSQPVGDWSEWSTTVLDDVRDLRVDLIRPRSPVSFKKAYSHPDAFPIESIEWRVNQRWDYCTGIEIPNFHFITPSGFDGVEDFQILQTFEKGAAWITFTTNRNPETLTWDLGTKFVLKDDRWGFSNGIPCQVVAIKKMYDEGNGQTEITAYTYEAHP